MSHVSVIGLISDKDLLFIGKIVNMHDIAHIELNDDCEVMALMLKDRAVLKKDGTYIVGTAPREKRRTARVSDITKLTRYFTCDVCGEWTEAQPEQCAVCGEKNEFTHHEEAAL